MWKFLICGCTSHQSEHQDQDRHGQDYVPLNRSDGASPISKLKRSRKAAFFHRHNNRNKNPYATQVLADLEEKKQNMSAQAARSEGISFVPFVSKNSNDLVPIIAKLKDNKKVGKTVKSCAIGNEYYLVKEKRTQSSKIFHDKFPTETSLASKEVKKLQGSEQSSKITKRSFLSWKMVEFDRLRRPSCYLPVVLILILIFLAVFGPSVVILSTSIRWYVVPMLKDSSSQKKNGGKEERLVEEIERKKNGDRRHIFS